MRARRFTDGTIWGIAAAAAVMLVAAVLPAYETVRFRAEDLLLAYHRPTVKSELPVVVVDIDRAALAAIGPWPWSRERLAGLVADIAAARPKALALDILIEGDDQRSPAALARRLADLTRRDDLTTLADGLPDGDQALATALSRTPSILGLALDPDSEHGGPERSPILVAGNPDLPGMWQAQGVSSPPAAMAKVAAGIGVLALPGDVDGRIRRVPLLAVAGNRLHAGLAVDAVRVASDGGALVVDGDDAQLRAGDLAMPLPSDAMLRLRPGNDTNYGARTIAALDVMRSADARQRLEGALVFVGSSAPEVGGLRTGAFGALVASVQIQADAAEQIGAGDAPVGSTRLRIFEALATVALAVAVAFAATRLALVPALLLAAGACSLWLLFCYSALDLRGLLADPVTTPAALVAAFATSALVAAQRARHREAAIRRRFEQQMPPHVLTRLLDDPALLKLEGEARRVTALFTDIEGFTAMTERAGPRALVRVLDRYFDGMVRIAIEHGGMVEKIVGDGLHAIFNAPLDLADHAAKAVACAAKMERFAEAFRASEDARALEFGATRIGIETGDVILGDVGGGRYLDYTAHGDVMNTAARLEAANKLLGSRICIGPVAATEPGLAGGLLRPLGTLDVRGRSVPLAIYGPWPESMSALDKVLWSEAAALLSSDPRRALQTFTELRRAYPADPVLARIIERYSGQP